MLTPGSIAAPQPGQFTRALSGLHALDFKEPLRYGQRPMPLRLLPLALLLSCAVGCATSSSAQRPRDPAAEARLISEIALLEDRRDALGLEALAKDASPQVRARALWALGRIQDVRTTGTVLGALQAPEPEVRAEAAFAAGLLLQSWDPLPEGLEAELSRALVAAEAVEREVPVQLRLLEAMGKAPSVSELLEARLRERLSDVRLEVAARAALSLGLLARRTGQLDERSVVALLGTLRADGPQALRYGGAYALAFSRAAPARPSLIDCAADADADVRALCVRGLAELGGAEEVPVLAARLSDPDPRVAVEAVRALIKQVEKCAPGPCAALEALGEVRRWAERLATAPAWNQPLLAFAQAGLAAQGKEVLAQVRASVQTALAAKADDSLAWLDCRLAAAQDRLAGALVETATCGAGRIPEAKRLALGLREIARTPPSAERATAFVPLLAHPSERVQTAALEAVSAAKVASALPEIRRLLASPDPIVAGNAAFALAALGDRESVPAVRALVQRAAAEPELAAVAGALAELAHPRDPKTPEEDASQKSLAAEIAAELRGWLASPEAALRTSAAAAIEKLTSQKLRPEVVPFPGPEGSAAEGARLTFNRERGAFAQPIPPAGAQLRFETTRGTFVVALDPVEAPLTSANLFNLAEGGYFDGLTFHRVVPDFVAQGGDPRGDGEGGPGYALRCEINHRSYRRGSFGMALSGKDTGGSQFFVTTSPQPHLDGRYTNFGEVVSGMEVVDRLVEEDQMIRVTAIAVP